MSDLMDILTTNETYFFREAFQLKALTDEILPEIKGVDFDSAWEKRVETVVDPDAGLKAFFISRDDLIAAKLAAARPQDLVDVDAIRTAAESQAPQIAKRKPREPKGPN